MRINKFNASNANSLNQYYKDIQSNWDTSYAIDLKNEAPAIANKLATLDRQQQETFDKYFRSTITSLDPETQKMLVGGTAVGALGAGFSLAALSIKQIGDLVGHPVLFTVGVSVLGVVAGAMTPKVLDYFSENKVSFTVTTPSAWNAVLPNMKLTYEGAQSK